MTPRPGWRWVVAMVALLALGAGLLPATEAGAADPPAVLVTAVAHFGGNYQPHTWVPVTVALENAGGNITGDVVVEVGGGGATAAGGGQGQPAARYFQRIELPTRAKKALTLYALVPDGVTSVAARFSSGKEAVDAPPVSLRALKSNQRLVGVIGDDARAGGELTRSLLASYGSGVEAVAVAPDELPANPYGLGSFSALLVNDASTGRWGEEQRRALAGWVAQGGQLVVVGGPNWRKTAEGLGELPPVRATDSRTIASLNGLGGLGSANRGPAGNFVVSTGEVIPGASRLAEQDGVALVASRSWGRGTVVSLAFDPAASDITGWTGAGTFWKRLALDTALPAPLQEPFVPSTNSSGYGSYAPGANNVDQILNDLPSLALPPTWLLLIVMTIFIIVVGPINYFVLRRLDRRELAWLTIPALTLLFAGGVYAFGTGTKGRATIVNSVSVVRIAPDARLAEAQAFYGVFAPSRGVRQLGVGQGALVASFSSGGIGDGDLGGDVRFEQGSNAAARDAYFSQWTLRQVAAQATIDPAPLALRVEARREGSKVVGQVTNTGNRPVEGVTLVLDGDYEQLGDLAAGASVAVDWTPSPTRTSSSTYRPNLGSAIYPGYSGGSSVQGVTERRRELLDAVSGSVIAYGRGAAGAYTPPTPTPSPASTPTPRPGGAATRTPPPTPTPRPGAGPTGAGAFATGPLQVIYWHPDAPLKLDVGASDREVTTLVIQETTLGGRTAELPHEIAAADEPRGGR